ncbi:NAD(P)-dependent oxidoreductase [Bacillus sp. FJAT-45350]|uniref:NAD(P)-dependent oxidoreductase n=1 Tax=Bacillus sp. FJAT-45350 TaxID=2011014 RepID=UPI000BB75827|nr:NAD(P)H-binding protein [Bacillus sp. FJAT-45350]
MNLFLLGGTGRVGSEILNLAVEENYNITVFTRSPDKIEKSYVQIIDGNVLDPTSLSNQMKGADIVVSALSTDGCDTISKSMPYIIEEMNKSQVNRIVTVGTAGILQSRLEPLKFRFQSAESKRKSTKAAEDHLKAYLLLKKSSLCWTIVCPTYLPEGEYTGIYRVEKDFLPLDGEKISVPDTAEFTFKQITNTQYLNTRVGISY